MSGRLPSERPIRVTRRLLSAALDGSLAKADFRRDPYFGFAVPSSVPGVEPHILFPVKTWANKVEFDKTARKLIGMFRENFKCFEGHVDESVKVLHVEAIGEVNDKEVMDLSARLRQEAAFISGYPILCDCSALTTVSISASLIEFLAKAARSRTNFVAVVARLPVAFGLARMFQIFSDPEYERIHVFAGMDEAMAWLEASVGKLTLHA